MQTAKLLLCFGLMFYVATHVGQILDFIFNLFVFIPYKFRDLKSSIKSKKRELKMYGLWLFAGRQGSGKTIGLVWKLSEIKRKYPKCLIYTNFECVYADGVLQSLNDLLTIRNGTDGVVFAIDELQNEFSSSTSKDFPETLLSMVTQQRKQRICILATSQVYTRVSKPLREQCFQVIECKTFFGRWTRLRAYDAEDYNSIVDSVDPKKKFKLHKIWIKSFIQSDNLRESYDTYSVIKRLSRDGFNPKKIV